MVPSNPSHTTLRTAKGTNSSRRSRSACGDKVYLAFPSNGTPKGASRRCNETKAVGKVVEKRLRACGRANFCCCGC